MPEGEPKFNQDEITESTEEIISSKERVDGAKNMRPKVIDAPLEQQDFFLDELKGRTANIYKETLDKYGLVEVEKSETEAKIIQAILERVPEFVEKFGGNPSDIKVENIRFIDIGEEGEKKGITKEVIPPLLHAFYISGSESMVVLRDESIFKEMHRVIHELLHANSFQSFESREVPGTSLSQKGVRRMGFMTYDKKVKDWSLGASFLSINESITEELTLKFENQHVDLLTEHTEEKTWPQLYSYVGDRIRLQNIIEEIIEKNPAYKEKEEVFNIFAEAAMNGNLLKISRLIEKTFGKGSFREMGNMPEFSKKYLEVMSWD